MPKNSYGYHSVPPAESMLMLLPQGPCIRLVRKQSRRQRVEPVRTLEHLGMDERLDAVVGEAAEEAAAGAVPQHEIERALLVLTVEEQVDALPVDLHNTIHASLTPSIGEPPPPASTAGGPPHIPLPWR